MNGIMNVVLSLLLSVSTAVVGDGRNGDDSDDGVPGVNGKWSHRCIEYSSAGRKNTFS